MSQSSIQELNDALDLEFWVQRESLAYKHTRGASGDQLNMRCCPSPDCGDERWRVYLNAESGIGNCFVCNKGYNKLTFVHTTLGGKWADTFAHVKDALKEQGWRPKRTIQVAVDPGEVKLPFSFELPINGQNLVYLEQRGITGELAAYFHLRYCEDAWWNFVKDDGSNGGQNFGNRVLIPVHDLDGVLKTFQGRDLTGTSDRKYLFPSGLPGTGRYLYNGHNFFASERAVLGEGAFDVFAIKIACDEDTRFRDIIPLGSFGKHLSSGDVSGNDQIGRFLKLKAKGLKEVTIMWDGEAKALVAALDAARKISALGIRAKVATLPAGKDPNEVPPHVVRDAIDRAQLYTPQLEIMWKLRNPYAGAR